MDLSPAVATAHQEVLHTISILSEAPIVTTSERTKGNIVSFELSGEYTLVVFQFTKAPGFIAIIKLCPLSSSSIFPTKRTKYVPAQGVTKDILGTVTYEARAVVLLEKVFAVKYVKAEITGLFNINASPETAFQSDCTFA